METAPEHESRGTRAITRGVAVAEFRAGVRAMAPIAVGDVLDGIAFGALAVAVLGRIAPGVLSATAFSGSAQYAALAVLRGHGTLVAALFAAAALNVRYLAMSGTVAVLTGGSRWRRALRCLLLTDASWSIASSGNDQQSAGARLAGAGLTELLAWTGGTVAGVLVGHAVGNPARFGLDAAYPAFFLWLLRDRIADRRDLLAAGIGAGLAAILTPVLPPGLPILAAGLAVASWEGARK